MKTYAHAVVTMGLILFFWEPSAEYPSRIPPYLYLILASYIYSSLPDRISDNPNDGLRFDMSHSAVTGSLILIPTVILRVLTGPLIFTNIGEFHGLIWFGYLSFLIAGISWIIHSLLDSFSGSGVRLLYPFSEAMIFSTGIDPKGKSINILISIISLALSAYRLADTVWNLRMGIQLYSSYIYIQVMGAFSALIFYWILFKTIGTVNRSEGPARKVSSKITNYSRMSI